MSDLRPERCDRPAARWLHRALLAALPPRFRAEYGPQMAADFNEALGDDEWPSGRTGRLIGDAGRTLAREWMRTGLPIVGLLAAAATAIALAALDRAWRHVQVQLTAATTEIEAVVLLLVVTVVVFLVAMSVAITLWSGRLLQRRAYRAARR